MAKIKCDFAKNSNADTVAKTVKRRQNKDAKKEDPKKNEEKANESDKGNFFDFPIFFFNLAFSDCQGGPKRWHVRRLTVDSSKPSMLTGFAQMF